MLSVIIATTDRDSNYINNLLVFIKNKIKIEHEVILVDNCLEATFFKEELINIHLKNKKPLNALLSKFKGVKAANGERVWIIDADDEVYEVSEEYEKYINYPNDIIYFKNNITKETGFSLDKRKRTDAYWNKWIKSAFFKKNIQKIENLNIDLEDIVFQEETPILALTNDYYFLDAIFYNYKVCNSGYYNGKKLEIKDIEKLFGGFDKLCLILIKLNLLKRNEWLIYGAFKFLENNVGRKDLSNSVIYLYKKISEIEEVKLYLKKFIIMELQEKRRIFSVAYELLQLYINKLII